MQNTFSQETYADKVSTQSQGRNALLLILYLKSSRFTRGAIKNISVLLGWCFFLKSRIIEVKNSCEGGNNL